MRGSFSPSLIDFDRKIELATEGLPHNFRRKLISIDREDALIIAKYILSMKAEINLSDNYRKLVIVVMTSLRKFHGGMSLDRLGRSHVLDFLDSYRKTEEQDPLHSWIGTYNLYCVSIVRFFRWFHYPDIEHKKRPKPSCVENIPQLKRKERSIYKPSDLWTTEDDLIFLKYCPSKRDRCYHTIARDTSCRPHEILKLRIKDVVFKMAGECQYAEVLVNGKTGSRHIPMINSLPYLKDWLDDHSQRGNPNAPLISGFGKSLGRPLKVTSMSDVYRRYQLNYFPKLLISPAVPPEDKNKIQELLKKPWALYIRRHTGLTDKSKILSEHVLRQHAGWSTISNMPQRYLHYFGNESSESILEAYGLKPKSSDVDKMKSKQCPNCSEPNKPDSRFCAKCRMVLIYTEYVETLEKQEQKENEIREMKREIQLMREGQKEWMDLLKNPMKLLEILRTDAT